MEISIKRADITYLKDIQNLNNQLFELEYNKFDSALKIGWTFEKDGEEYFNNMLNNETLQINSYPSGIREMVSRNHILWIGEQGGYCEAILECNRAIADCVRRATLNTLPSLYYARAYNMQKFREVYPECLSDVENKIKLDYIRCALLAELVHDRKGSEKALSALKKIIS